MNDASWQTNFEGEIRKAVKNYGGKPVATLVINNTMVIMHYAK